MNAEDIPSVSAVFISCKNVTRQKNSHNTYNKKQSQRARPQCHRAENISHINVAQIQSCRELMGWNDHPV